MRKCSTSCVSFTLVGSVCRIRYSAGEDVLFIYDFIRPHAFAFRSRTLATAAADASTSAPPPPSTPSDPKLTKLVDDISGLTLLQAADLVTLLKVRKHTVVPSRMY